MAVVDKNLFAAINDFMGFARYKNDGFIVDCVAVEGFLRQSVEVQTAFNEFVIDYGCSIAGCSNIETFSGIGSFYGVVVDKNIL